MTEDKSKPNPVLNFFSLSDDYERRARFLPAVLTVLVALPVAMAFGIEMMQFVTLLTTGVGIGAVLAVGISHLASALGNRLQKKLWPDWPYDAPTNQWLKPDNAARSQQQKKQWYGTIKAVTGLDIAKLAKSDDGEEARRVINDAVSKVRSRLWKQDGPATDLVRLRNIDYGYARNLTGLRVIWIPAALLSCAGCWVAWWKLDGHILWAVLSTVLLCILPLVGVFVLPGYVRQKADYYAEAFFAAMERLNADENAA
ncbi:hypothetical protein [Gimesia sp.]|uniref:hypothetical protein n=1 Tax=Gimesia sp. TaxID=2024833 RepID=UPI0032EC0B23